ncbi:hypothetical protein LPLAFNJD_LOCUS597 [Methylorubrum aminovorans]
MSSTGEKVRQARRLSANQIPTGTPITSAAAVAMLTRTRVSTVACHSLRFHRNSRPASVRNPILRPPTR